MKNFENVKFNVGFDLEYRVYMSCDYLGLCRKSANSGV